MLKKSSNHKKQSNRQFNAASDEINTFATPVMSLLRLLIDDLRLFNHVVHVHLA